MLHHNWIPWATEQPEIVQRTPTSKNTLYVEVNSTLPYITSSIPPLFLLHLSPSLCSSHAPSSSVILSSGTDSSDHQPHPLIGFALTIFSYLHSILHLPATFFSCNFLDFLVSLSLYWLVGPHPSSIPPSFHPHTSSDDAAPLIRLPVFSPLLSLTLVEMTWHIQSQVITQMCRLSHTFFYTHLHRDKAFYPTAHRSAHTLLQEPKWKWIMYSAWPLVTSIWCIGCFHTIGLTEKHPNWKSGGTLATHTRGLILYKHKIVKNATIYYWWFYHRSSSFWVHETLHNLIPDDTQGYLYFPGSF